MGRIIITILLFSIVISSCSKSKDPLDNENFGYLKKEKLISEFKKSCFFKDDIEDDGEGELDIFSILQKYEYLLPINNDTVMFWVKFSPRIQSYAIGNQTCLSLHANLDNTDLDVMDVINKYDEWYGPSKISYTASEENFFTAGGKSDSIMEREWSNQRVKVILKSPENFGLSKDQITILYQTVGHEENQKRIRDSIEDNQSFEKLLKFEKPRPTWTKLRDGMYSFKFNMNPSRAEHCDLRAITAIRFKLELWDEFNELLYLTNTLTMTLEYPLEADGCSNPEVNYFNQNLGNRQVYEMEYYRYASDVSDLEKTRIYSENNKISSKVWVSQVVFDDGSVLSH
ncbi:MAG: hypothetical protein HRT65_03225 [Flavobacteriaceae bacterium]|nr:hypothetical protein [Flavobacteriaceae bacterium]